MYKIGEGYLDNEIMDRFCFGRRNAHLGINMPRPESKFRRMFVAGLNKKADRFQILVEFFDIYIG